MLGIFLYIYRYLIPCTHVMVSQRSRVRDIDLYNQAAEKFLSLIPSSSVLHNSITGSSLPSSQSTPTPFTSGFHSLQNLPPLSRGGSLRLKRHQRSPSTSSFAFGDLDRFNSAKSNTEWYVVNHGECELSNYMDYLQAAHQNVKACTLACHCWSATYDGLDPPPSALSSSYQSKDNEFSQNFIQNNQLNNDSTNELKNSHIQKSGESGCNNVLELSSVNLAAHQDSLQETQFDRTSCIEKNFVIKSLYRHKDETFNSDLLNEIINTDDERTFWNLVCSTNTPHSVDNLDDSLETIDGYLNDIEETDSRQDSKVQPLFSDNIDLKDECSNADSGVFESRESCVSEKDSDIIIMSAKPDDHKESLFITIPPKTELKPGSSVSETSTKSSNSPASPSTWESFGTPNIGPFLSILLTRLEMMMQNDVYTNLHLTGLISRLACYPQPLLRSFLLNPSLVFQPTVRSLFQVSTSKFLLIFYIIL